MIWLILTYVAVFLVGFALGVGLTRIMVKKTIDYNNEDLL